MDIHIDDNARFVMHQLAMKTGVQVRHRPRGGIMINETGATILPDMMNFNGFQVGEEVMLLGSKVPQDLFDNDVVQDSDGNWTDYGEKLYRILGFFLVEGRVGKCKFAAHCCAVQDFGFLGREDPRIDKSTKSGKIFLYWTDQLCKRP